jgi:signal transduction histidine kinase
VLFARADNGSVAIGVRDEGVGIPADQVEQIFNPFHGSFGRGTGLGLAIVHRIVTDYNGRIDVQSAPGHGTTIITRFPAAGVSHSAGIATTPPS